jgi:hypothetical protein
MSKRFSFVLPTATDFGAAAGKVKTRYSKNERLVRKVDGLKSKLEKTMTDINAAYTAETVVESTPIVEAPKAPARKRTTAPTTAVA